MNWNNWLYADRLGEEKQTTKPQTNADRIRAMSDEELAWELMTWRLETEAKHHGVESNYPNTQATILEWLRSPHDDDPSFIVFGGRRGEGKVFHLEKVLADKKREVAELRGIMQQTDGVPERICKLDEEIKALEAEISDIRSRWG